MKGEGGECFDWVGVDGVSVSEGRGEWLRENPFIGFFAVREAGG